MVNPISNKNEVKKGLYLVPTPIGNLGDITLRSLEILKNSDCILCEDTRISKNLLNKFEIKTKVISNHKFNETKNLSKIINLLKEDKIIFFLVFNFILINGQANSQENKIKIGLLVPLTGDNAELGKQILNSTRLAIKDINSNQIEIYPKDTQSDPNKALQSAIKLEQMGINIVIGPVFYKNIIYLDEVKNITFLS